MDDIGESVVSKENVSPFWGQFDMIVCIHSNRHSGNKNNATALFQTMGIPARFLAFETTDAQSTFEAHRRAMQIALESRCNNVVVLEDDIAKLNELEQLEYDDITHFVQHDKKWDVFFLGVHANVFFQTSRRVESSIFKVQSACTHAYVASRGFMQKMSRLDFEVLNCAFGHLLEQNFNTFCVFPTLFYKPGPASLSNVKHLARKISLHCKNEFSRWSPLAFVYVVWALFLLLFMWLLIALFRKRSRSQK